MSAREREIRSRLAQLLSREALVRATLAVREKSCGRANCHCARGELHPALYLVASDEGRRHQLFVPRSLADQARECVETYQKIRELLEELSRIYWDKLQRREL